MHIQKYITIRIENGVAVILAANATKITFVGASCACSAPPNTGDLTAFSLFPEKGKQAVFAVRLYYNPSGAHAPMEKHGLLLSLVWDGDKLIGELDKHFVPDAPMLAHVDDRGVFCLTCPAGDGKERGQFVAAGKSHIGDFVARGWRAVDGNLLCKFLVGAVGYDELSKQAEESLLEKLQRESVAASKEISDLRRELEANSSLLRASEQKLASALTHLTNAESECKALKNTLGFISNLQGKLKSVALRNWSPFNRKTWFGGRIKSVEEILMQMESHNPSRATWPEHR